MRPSLSTLASDAARPFAARPPVTPRPQLGRGAKIPLAVLLGVALLSPAAQAEAPSSTPEGQDILDVQRFGKSGDLRPTAGDSLIDDGFYTQDMTFAAASREYHTAVWRVPGEELETLMRVEKGSGEVSAVGRPAAPADLELGLLLSNPHPFTKDNAGEGTDQTDRTGIEKASAPELVDITVSLRFENGARNHLVRLDPGQERGLMLPSATAELGRLETVLLLAFGPFEAKVESSRGRGDRSEGLEVMAPVSDSGAAVARAREKAIDYCQNITSWLRVANSLGYVVARGFREYQRDHSITGEPIYYHDIEYPAGTLFHRGNGASGTNADPVCRWQYHSTVRTDFSKSHRWSGMDDLVLGCIGPASAVCRTGCTGTFTVTLTGSSVGRCF